LCSIVYPLSQRAHTPRQRPSLGIYGAFVPPAGVTNFLGNISAFLFLHSVDDSFIGWRQARHIEKPVWSMEQDIRWKQRFQNFNRAVVLLREPIERDVTTLSNLEREGTIQRFEFAVDLAWKTLKDFLEFEGHVISPSTPRNVIKEAFAARILTDGQVWIDMLDHRNLLSHTYDETTFEKAVIMIRDRYLSAFEELHLWLMEQMTR
jgi:nucleotidyltransferase substrate binding protein (TIGR01987 family)